jgi:hypothetical protein
MGLSRDLPSNACSLRLAYQAVRNLAAARAIGDQRDASFVVAYDERNPYFTGAGQWPGWVAVLKRLTEWSRIPVHFLSWQQLLSAVGQDRDVASWAGEKHGLQS